jgi:hypothetical protein
VSAFFPLPNQTSPKFNLVSEKVNITFSPMGVRLHYPQPMKLFISPSELCKIDQITPNAVLKNHSKSQKIHKMENQIVLDFK